MWCGIVWSAACGRTDEVASDRALPSAAGAAALLMAVAVYWEV